MERARAGERAAFGVLYSQYRSAVYGYLRARLLHSGDAEDLCQEVFLRVFGAIARFDARTPFPAWLLGITRNVLREHVRRQRRSRENGWTELCLDLEALAPAESLYSDVLHHVPLCLASLSEPAAQALHAHYMAGRKVQDIAQQMGRTLGAVKVLMVRARQALKRCIENRLKGMA